MTFEWTIAGDGLLDDMGGRWTAESIAMLSTGLHDAEGREVFEGDTLALIDAYPPVSSTVVYHEGAYFLSTPPGADGPLALAPLLARLPFRVIGNVYETEG